VAHGGRARIGAIVVSNDLTAEPEYRLMGTDAAAVYAARMMMIDELPPLERLALMAESAASAATSLATLSPDVVMYCCTSASFFRGAEHEASMVQALAEITGCPVISTARASVEALRSVGARRVAVATPYTDDINVRLIDYLTAAGFEVTGLRGAQLVANEDTCALSPSTIRSLIRDAIGDTVPDAVFFSCTAVPIVGQIERLESEFGVPIITANQATWWAALRAAGVEDRLAGYGQLLVQ
jgi:maleate cis-trans isomerase